MIDLSSSVANMKGIPMGPHVQDLLHVYLNLSEKVVSESLKTVKKYKL